MSCLNKKNIFKESIKARIVQFLVCGGLVLESLGYEPFKKRHYLTAYSWYLAHSKYEKEKSKEEKEVTF